MIAAGPTVTKLTYAGQLTLCKEHLAGVVTDRQTDGQTERHGLHMSLFLYTTPHKNVC